MAIIQTVNFNSFCGAFLYSDRNDSFSAEAKSILFDHLEDMSDGYDNDIELDVIGICCEYQELHYTDIISEYGIDVSEIDEDDAQALIDAVEEFLRETTMVCGMTKDDCFVFVQF